MVWSYTQYGGEIRSKLFVREIYENMRVLLKCGVMREKARDSTNNRKINKPEPLNSVKEKREHIIEHSIKFGQTVGASNASG